MREKRCDFCGHPMYFQGTFHDYFLEALDDLTEGQLADAVTQSLAGHMRDVIEVYEEWTCIHCGRTWWLQIA